MRQRTYGGERRPSRFRKRKFFSHKESKLDVRKFINKAVPAEQKPENKPKHTFDDFNLDSRIKDNVKKRGYKSPTPIQDQIIPHLILGKDVIGIANTGTGKTAAFLLPLINKVLIDRNEEILILAPTRELALQIEEELREFARTLEISSVLCIGGTSMGFQIRQLKRRNNFIIATPGRLKDLIERRLVNLSSFKTVVLDEADRMVDMGFINDIKYLLAKLPKHRHTLFFSATISSQIEELIRTFLYDPVKVSVKVRETAENIEQDVIHIKPNESRVNVLQELLRKREFSKVLVFGRTKRGVDSLSNQLYKDGFKVDCIHGNKPQSKRQSALRDLKDYRVQLLVATDVAARGLDIEDVSHVINYDMPSTHEDYIHRIGRTGRGNKRGIALTFIEGK
jgi:superfamily II DNA/RNA helicase